MKNSKERTFTVQVEQENDIFIWTVLENDVSSFWDTKEEALNMTIEALQWYLEVLFEMEQEKSVREMPKNIKEVSKNQYSLSFPSYASNFQVYGDRRDSKKTLMVA